MCAIHILIDIGCGVQCTGHKSFCNWEMSGWTLNNRCRKDPASAFYCMSLKDAQAHSARSNHWITFLSKYPKITDQYESATACGPSTLLKRWTLCKDYSLKTVNYLVACRSTFPVTCLQDGINGAINSSRSNICTFNNSIISSWLRTI